MITRLAIELALIDGASGVARRAAKELASLGEAGKVAAKAFEGMAEDWGNSLKALAVASELKTQLVDPGLAAAAELQAGLKSLEVQLDRGSVAEMQEQLRQAGAEASRIAGPTKFSNKEVLGIFTDLKTGGVGMSDILGKGGAGEAVAQLATAEGDMGAEAATAAVQALGKAFRLGGAEYASAADMLVRAGSVADSGAVELAAALQNSTSEALVQGLKMEDTLAGLVVADKGGNLKGSEAGTALTRFLQKSATADKEYGLGLFEDGQFVGLEQAQTQLRAKMAGKTAQDQSIALNKMFDVEGGRFAAALMAGPSLGQARADMAGSLSLSEKVGVLNSGYSAQSEALSGSTDTMLATLFQPALAPFTAGISELNDAVGRFTAATQEDPRIAQATSAGAVGATAAVGAAGLAFALRSGARGLQGLGALRGLGGTAAGVAQGKAVEAATGVQAVFVVNWPDKLGSGGGLDGAPPIPGGATGLLGGLGKALGVGAAATGGYAVGSAINENLIQGTALADIIQGGIGTALLSNPILRGLSSEETLDSARLAQRQALAGLGLNVEVKVDKSGNAEVTAKTTDGQRMARAGVRQVG